MKYIDVIVKKTGQKINILEGEFSDQLYERTKELKEEVKTKEEKTVPKTKKARVITSESMKQNED